MEKKERKKEREQEVKKESKRAKMGWMKGEERRENQERKK